MKSKLQNRRVAFKEVKKPLLIVCEDSKSSVLYFKEKIKDCRISPISIDVDGSCDSDPMSVVNHAIKRKKEQKQLARKNNIYEYEHVYCVIDVDEHKNLKQAINKAKDNGIIPIISNQCFELWYLLHFINYSTAFLDRNTIYKELKTYLGKEYDKADKSVYYSIKDKEDKAIKIAERLIESAIEESQEEDPYRNPSTEVHVLIQKLNSYE